MQFTSITKLRLHTWRIAVLPPSCSTNPCGTAFIFYLSSRRQPTSAPSRFSLSNHVPSSSGTRTHTVHLRVLSAPHLRRRGACRSPVYTYHSSGSPTFGSSTASRNSINISTRYLALLRPNSFQRHFLHLILQGPFLILIVTVYSLLFFATLIPSLPYKHGRPNSLHLILHMKAANIYVLRVPNVIPSPWRHSISVKSVSKGLTHLILHIRGTY